MSRTRMTKEQINDKFMSYDDNNLIEVNGKYIIHTSESPFGSHRYETFSICKRRYWLKYVNAQIHNKGGTARGIGTLIHLALAQYYMKIKNKQNKVNIDLYEPMEAVELMANTYGLADHIEKVRTIFNNYVLKYGVEDSSKSIMSVEEIYGIVLEHERLKDMYAPLTARIDLVYRGSNSGKVYFMDHKTSGFISQNHIKFYSMSSQILFLQYIGEVVYGNDFGGVVINSIQTGEKSLFKREKPLYFERAINDNVLSTILRFDELMSIDSNKEDDFKGTYSEHTCWTRYGACDFYEICGVKNIDLREIRRN